MKGHLRKRGERSYELIVYLGRDPKTGKKQYQTHSVKGTKRKAESELARIVNDLQTGGYVSPVKLTVADFLDQWLRTYAEGNVSGKTFERYKGIVNLHLKPAFENLPLQRLTPLHIQSYYAGLMKDGSRKDGREGGLSAQTVLHHHRILSEALAMAVRWQLLARNPADAVDPPEVRPKEVKVIDQTETAWLLSAAEGTRLYVPILFAVTAGLRRGEILALAWEHLNLSTGAMRVSRSVEETKQFGIRFKEAKGKRSRPVTLPSFLLDALRVHQQKQIEMKEALGTDYCDEGLVCAQPDGRLWKPSAFTSSYRALLKRRGLSGPNFHALRHSHASHLLEDGIDLKLVSERLGHSRASFTLDRYIHLLPGRDQEAATRIDTSLRAAIAETRKGRVM